MLDRYERECDERDKIRITIKNEHSIAKKIREMYPTVKEYRKLTGDLQRAGYRIEERDNDVKIWKEI